MREIRSPIYDVPLGDFERDFMALGFKVRVTSPQHVAIYRDHRAVSTFKLAAGHVQSREIERFLERDAPSLRAS